MAWILNKKLQKKVPIFKPIITIGNDFNSDIHIANQTLAPLIGHLQKIDNKYILSILDNKANVTIAGKKVLNYELKDKDEIVIGDQNFIYCESEPILEVKKINTQEIELQALRRLLHFSQRLASEKEISKLLEALIDEIIGLSKAEHGFLVLIENESPKVIISRSHNNTSSKNIEDCLSDSILQKVLESKKPLLINDALNHQDFSASRSVIDYKLSSIMCAPLINQGVLLGAIYVGNNSLINAFNLDRLEILMLFSMQASLIVQNALHVNALKNETLTLQKSLEEVKFESIIGACKSMQEVISHAKQAAQTNLNVLLIGEKGVGKELIAREIHARSSRVNQPFLTLSCFGMTESLIDEDLFGGPEQSFFGIKQKKLGKFNLAKTGTLFIDDIDEMPLQIQNRILQTLRINTGAKEADLPRIIAATKNETLLNPDFYNQIADLKISIPPLRERENDIILMANYFLNKFAKMYNKSVGVFNKATQNALINYNWPGNISQLEVRIKRYVIMCDGKSEPINPKDLELNDEEQPLSLSEAIDRFRQKYISQVLERNDGNKTKAAKDLQVDPRTIFRHLESLKMS
jgi:transcriptional regulator with GAF, ATPase, and Fis domain